MEQSERYWCPTCERIHLDECEFSSLTPSEGSGNLLSVRRTESNSSAMGSLALDGGQFAAQPTACEARAGDLTALPFPSPGSTTPSGATSDKRHVTAERYCPLCCIAGSIPCGSGKHLDKNSENTDKPYRSLSSPPGESKPLQGSSPFGIIWSVCAWCEAILGADLGPAADDGIISHGMCRQCFAKQMNFLVVLLVPWALLSMGFFSKVVSLA